MKKISTMFFVLGLAFAAVPSAFTQIFAIPSVRIAVANSTSDGSKVSVSMAGRMAISPVSVGGEPFRLTFYGAGYGIGNAASLYQITACPANALVSHTSADNLPSWVTDPRYLGNAALTWDYLDSDPSAPDMERRIANIEKVIKSRQELGYQVKIHDLKQWLKDVKKVGLAERITVCNPAAPGAQTFTRATDVTSWNNWPVVLITISGSAGHYRQTISRVY